MSDQPGGPIYGDAPRYGYLAGGGPPPPTGGTAAGDPASPYGSAPAPYGSTGQQPYGLTGQQSYQPYQQLYPPSSPPPFPPPSAGPDPGPSGGPPQPWPAGGPWGSQPFGPVYAYAHWGRRVGAFVIDFAPTYVAMTPFYIGYFLWLSAFSGSLADGGTVPTDGLIWMLVGGVLLLAALGWQIYNRWITAGRTGQSLGKRVLRIRLLAEISGQPIGPLNAFLRDMLHVLDGIAYVGYLWPLWDAKRQTFADILMKTVVIDAAPNGSPTG